MTTALKGILSHHGLPDRKISAIAPSPGEEDLWRVMFSFGPGNPVSIMDISRALRLAEELRDASQFDLARVIEVAATTAKRYSCSNKK